MTSFHCPLCPLVFAHRTELEWHVRAEHEDTGERTARLRAEAARALRRAPDAAELERLGSARAEPSVSVFLSTVPASSMTPIDALRLRHLAGQARRRLPPHPDPRVRTSVEDRLIHLVQAAEESPTSRALALYVSTHDMATQSLDAPVEEDVVVSDRFVLVGDHVAPGA